MLYLFYYFSGNSYNTTTILTLVMVAYFSKHTILYRFCWIIIQVKKEAHEKEY